MSDNKNIALPIKFNRRDFLQNCSVICSGIAAAPDFPGNAHATPPVDSNLFWYQKPLRIMHTVLRESDAKDYDAAKVVDYMQKCGCNTLCVNAGGIVDFFQNPLPAANLNQYMGSRDILKEITTACKAAGIKVIGRIDFRGVEERVYQKFPDWFKKDADGNPVQTNYTKPKLYESCFSGHYRNEYANEFVTYVMKNYGLDGIWHNAPGFGGICYCEKCKESYRKFSGKDIPKVNDASADIDTYMQWKVKAGDEYMSKIKKTVKSFGDDKAYTAEVFSIYGVGQRIDGGIDLRNARDHFDILVSVAFLTENTDVLHYENLNYGSTIIKFLKSMAPEREAVVMYGGNGTAHRLVIDPPVDLKIWLWEILSAGGRFWNCYFTNVPTVTHDRRNAFNESDAYQFVKANEKLLEQHAPEAAIGIYYSNPTRLSFRTKSEEGDKFGSSIRGAETVLMENHIPHDFVLNDQLGQEKLSKYKLLILPDVRCMSDKEIDTIKRYVENGGNLVATYTTSLYDESGKERSDFGLNELFGVHYAGKKENTRKDNYQHILNKNHPLVVDDSPNTELLFTAGFTALSKPFEEDETICTWVPTIQNQPPDKASVLGFPDEFPTVVEHKYGKGKVIYFANQPDMLSYEVGHPDSRNLLLRSVKYLAGDAIAIQTNAPSTVHIGLTGSLQHKNEFILSLVNTTSGPTRPVRELIPINGINVKLKLTGKSVAAYKVMRTQGDCRVLTRGNQIECNISKLQDFCAIHFRMNG